ncbi:MAG: NnrU family protein [Proteobacteria bacterium]|nr:NnrU family protein [Pseudomonadota bacterium]
MLQLLSGFALFFGMHSMSILALPLRDKFAAKSEIGWKLVYGAVSLAGLILMSRGYAELRLTPTILYIAPVWLYHVAAVLLIPTFVLFLAPYFPGRISSATKHPQLVAVKLWAMSHLLVNGTLADLLLFGSFLLWAVAVRISLKRRATRAIPGMPESKANDIIAVVLGLIVYAATVSWFHEMLFGVRPFV